MKIAVYASLIANIALSCIQGKFQLAPPFLRPYLTFTVLVYAAVSSLSLSFFATAVDSVFDPMSNVLLWWLHRMSKRLDTNKWPVGGARLETIGNICYGMVHWFPCFSFTQSPPGFLYVRMKYTQVTPPNNRQDVCRQPCHHCRVYPFDCLSQGQ